VSSQPCCLDPHLLGLLNPREYLAAVSAGHGDAYPSPGIHFHTGLPSPVRRLFISLATKHAMTEAFPRTSSLSEQIQIPGSNSRWSRILFPEGRVPTKDLVAESISRRATKAESTRDIHRDEYGTSGGTG
jgi:hypothetical protein